ncbi:uncharacterized protein BP5553_00279 [Venustampulla echinocandica]|uniref:peptidyl-tRNA hydrolase n=1 Tax=Venustampulla echinocandica TaxID=2656787 RepID=A0A370TXR4_9HELO|nr:uncharacterized protein BP5553_00279 [Venustampulla echinocandica]RDL40300.1 hypothetical protein BP5553_00279 [Venustampulla echinocandica]
MAERAAPTPMAMLISTAILAGIGGYMIGVFSSLGFLPIPFRPTSSKPLGSRTENYDNEEESEEEDIDETVLDHAPDWGNGTVEGKIAAQCSHATLACYKRFLRNAPDSPILRRWERQGQAKVALQVKSEEELELLQATARSLGLVAEVIADAGRTQIASGSHTVLGIGPAPKSAIDKVTGNLKLL